jgi:hypothetical protein
VVGVERVWLFAAATAVAAVHSGRPAGPGRLLDFETCWFAVVADVIVGG